MNINTTEPSLATPGVLRSAQRLLHRKGRLAARRFLVEGPQAVREALKLPGFVDRILVVDPTEYTDLLWPHRIEPDLAAGSSGRQMDNASDGRAAGERVTATPLVFTVSAEQMTKLSDTVTPQGIVAVCHLREGALSDVADPRLVVICVQVRDPGNAGTVIRCADAFGADAVLMTTGSVDLYNPKTIRASVGSVFHLPVITGLTLKQAVNWCVEHGLQVLAADSGGEILSDLQAAGDLAQPTAWMMGNEAWGLPPGDAELAHRMVGVPMWGQAESLNLSTAAAVCLYATASAQRDALTGSSGVLPE